LGSRSARQGGLASIDDLMPAFQIAGEQTLRVRSELEEARVE